MRKSSSLVMFSRRDRAERGVPESEEQASRRASRRLKWLLIAGLLTLPGIYFTCQFYLNLTLANVKANTASEWLAPFALELLRWSPWVLLTPLILWLGSRFPLEGRRGRFHGLFHLIFSVVVCVVFLAVFLLLYGLFSEHLAGRGIDRATFWIVALEFVPPYFVAYWIVLVVGHTLAYYQRNRESEAHLAQARLQALKAQIHPHFLFNTLHAISTLMDDDVKAAQRMIARLSELLRVSLSSSDSHEVALSEELELVKLYLSIEEVRFEDRLRVSYDIEPEVGEALVPHLVLQPLVENAIRHGITRLSDAGRLEIVARRENGRLRLAVFDDGPGLSDSAPGEGTGLVNIRSRLEQLYGDDSYLEIRDREPRGCEVILEVPIRWNRPVL